jgi:hypothetical protein
MWAIIKQQWCFDHGGMQYNVYAFGGHAIFSALIIGRNRYEVAGMSGKIANFVGSNALWANQRSEKRVSVRVERVYIELTAHKLQRGYCVNYLNPVFFNS